MHLAMYLIKTYPSMTRVFFFFRKVNKVEFIYLSIYLHLTILLKYAYLGLNANSLYDAIFAVVENESDNMIFT